jgi:hypothetical protein
MLDTNTLLVLCWSGAECANGAREAKEIKCNVMNDVDDKIRSVGRFVVHCERKNVSDEVGLVMEMNIQCQ